jgi:hypothetical protein
MQVFQSWHSVRSALGRKHAVRGIACDRGQSLVMAMVMMGTLTIMTAGVIAYMTSSQQSFTRDKSVNRSVDVAEAGVNNAVSILSTFDNLVSQPVNTVVPSGATVTSPSTWQSFTLDGITGKYMAQKTVAGSSGTWLITAQATQGGVTRQLQEQVVATPGSTIPSAVYGYGLYVGGSSGCTNIQGNYSVTANIYIANSLCPGGNVNINAATPNAYTLYVGGSYQGTNNTQVGSAAIPFARASIVGGCTTQGHPQTCSIPANSNVYANAYDSTAQSVTKPSVDLAAIYAGANWNSPTCSTGSFVFDNNTTRNMSVGTVSLDSGNYNCTVAGAGGGTLAYNTATNVLTVSGTIFIDGNLSEGSPSNFKYSGSGVIYANGTVSTSGDICGPGRTVSGNSCAGTWNTTPPTGGVLEIVAGNAAGAAAGWNMGANEQLDVDAFVVGKFSGSGGGLITGSIVADAADISGGGGLYYPAPPPNNAPGNTTLPSTWALKPSSWQQVTPN